MKEGKCYCRIENPGSAYVFKENCPKHGKPKKENIDAKDMS